MVGHKKWSSALKFEIVLQVLKSEKALAKICQRYEVAPSIVERFFRQVRKF